MSAPRSPDRTSAPSPPLTAHPVSMVSLFIFATAEGAITTMAASIPILRALFHRNARPTTPPQPSQF